MTLKGIVNKDRIPQSNVKSNNHIPLHDQPKAGATNGRKIKKISGFNDSSKSFTITKLALGGVILLAGVFAYKQIPYLTQSQIEILKDNDHIYELKESFKVLIESNLLSTQDYIKIKQEDECLDNELLVNQCKYDITTYSKEEAKIYLNAYMCFQEAPKNGCLNLFKSDEDQKLAQHAEKCLTAVSKSKCDHEGISEIAGKILNAINLVEKLNAIDYPDYDPNVDPDQTKDQNSIIENFPTDNFNSLTDEQIMDYIDFGEVLEE